jgi:CO/xanthine dehydrogenase FAD-binding subunit
MRPLSYARATDVDGAIATAARRGDSAFLAGGTTEVDLVRQNVLWPGLLVDINDLPLNRIEDLPDGGLRIGALARMSDVAQAAGVVQRFPVISQALLLGASAQLRNMASMGGNFVPAGAVQLLPRRDVAVQQAQSGQRLRGPRWLQPRARHPRHQRQVHRDASFGCGGRAGRPGRGRAYTRAGR